jgi:hypothetical protein
MTPFPRGGCVFYKFSQTLTYHIFPKKYFPRQDGEPPPLTVVLKRRVGFEEVDVLGMVWRGRYPGLVA